MSIYPCPEFEFDEESVVEEPFKPEVQLDAREIEFDEPIKPPALATKVSVRDQVARYESNIREREAKRAEEQRIAREHAASKKRDPPPPEEQQEKESVVEENTPQDADVTCARRDSDATSGQPLGSEATAADAAERATDQKNTKPETAPKPTGGGQKLPGFLSKYFYLPKPKFVLPNKKKPA